MMDKLDELQLACEKVLSLLKDRQGGLVTWNLFLISACQKLTELLIRDGTTCPRCNPDELDHPRQDHNQSQRDTDNPPRADGKKE